MTTTGKESGTKPKLVVRLLARWGWVGVVVALWGFLLFASAPNRGFTESGLWQIEQTESAREWLRQLSATPTEALSAPSYEAAFRTDPQRGPLNGLVPAALWRIGRETLDAMGAARRANSLRVCLAAWCLFAMGRRAAGVLAGLGAAVALLCVPRIWAMATSPDLSAGALLAFTLAPMLMERARERWIWVIPAVLGVAMALLFTQLAFLLFIPWIALTFFATPHTRQSSAPMVSGKPNRGLLISRGLGLGALAFPAGLLLAAWLLSLLDHDMFASLKDYLRTFMVRPRDPTLYFGDVYSNERLPWHAAPILTLLTTPPTVLFLAIFGLTVASPWARRLLRKMGAKNPSGAFSTLPEGVAPGGEARAEVLRLAWTMLPLTAFLPLVLGTTHSHGVDLLALMVPWLAIFAGLGLRQMLEVLVVRVHAIFAGRTGTRLATLAVLAIFSWGLFVFALRDTVNAYPEVESYYNWLVAGVDGAAGAGLPRNPRGPIPPAFLRQLMDADAEATIALVGGEPMDAQILERYRDFGLIPPGFGSAPLETAQLVLVRYNELSPDYHRLLPDFYAVIDSVGEAGSRWLRREGIPLFGAARLDP